MESRVPGNWLARFGKQRGGNTGYAVRPCADFTDAPDMTATTHRPRVENEAVNG